MRSSFLTGFLTLSILIFGRCTAHAQQADTLFYRPTGVPAHLKPIERSGWGGYYYGGRRLRSVQSLEIPFGELNDPEANMRYRRYRTGLLVGQIVSFAPLAYILLNGSGRRLGREYWYYFWGSLGVSIGSSIYANGQMNKGIMRYNQALRQARFGVSVQPLPTGGLAPGAGVALRF